MSDQETREQAGLFFISDIFGRTPALETLCRQVCGRSGRFTIIDPYGGQDQGFSSEARAYAVFTERVGLEAYSRIIAARLGRDRGHILAAAFSVGASALWRLSRDTSFSRIRQAVCFYGSQIRHHPDITPCFRIRLIFPDHEPHFDVDDLMERLETKDRVSCRKAAGRHGFMNQCSPNFDPDLYSAYTACLKKTLCPRRLT